MHYSEGPFSFFKRRRRHTRFDCDWSSDVCSSDLPDKKRERFKELSKELSDLAIDFSSNLRAYRDSLPVTADQLAGMDSDYIERLERTPEGKYVLTLDYPVFLPYKIGR